jgi:hypothetical protein
MKKHYEDKIKLFTALAGSLSIFSVNTAEAQTIVVRDINPDTMVDAANPIYDLDIDNDGSVDFEISRISSTNNYGTTFFYFKGTGHIGYYMPSAGTSNTHTFVSQNGSDWYVAKLNVGDTTTFTSEYNDNLYTRLFDVSGTDGGTPTLTDDYQWTAGTTDKYVGVQFTIGNQVHFGWVQLSVAADYSTITVEKVAYESSPRALMKAGATVSANAAASVTIDDHGNNADASDIRVTIAKAANEANITTYRAYVVPIAQINSATLDVLQTTAVGNYQDIAKTGSNIITNLSATLKDIYGNDIVEGTAYKVIIESVGDSSTGDALSIPSNTVTLSTMSVITGITSPNTMTGKIYSSGSTVYLTNIEKNCKASIISVTGIEIYNGSINAGDSNIILSGETSGVYIVRLTAADGTSAIQKVMLQN